jgi:hypothetical protein
MLTRREWVCLLLGAVFATAYQAWSSPEIQLELGQCRFGKAPDGTFYQSDYQTTNYLTPRCMSLGLADKFEKGGRIGWRVAYIVTGSIEARDNLFIRNDDGLRSIPCDPPNFVAGCHATMNGSGNMRGLSFSGTADLPLGPVTVTGEMGLLFFKSQFKATALPVDYVGQVMEVNEESKWWDTPTPMLGVSLRYGDVYIAARHYWPAEHRPLSLTDHSFTQLSVGLVFKLP